jgi:hypothetical protein
MSIENLFGLILKERCFTLLVLQLHFDITHELLILCEYRYHGNWTKPSS